MEDRTSICISKEIRDALNEIKNRRTYDNILQEVIERWHEQRYKKLEKEFKQEEKKNC